MSLWRNDIKCNYMFMFPLKHLARKGLRWSHHLNNCWCIFLLLCTDIMMKMKSSNGNIFCISGPLWGDAELWCVLWSAPNNRLSKQLWGWWFEMSSHSLWHHCNDKWNFHQDAIIIIQKGAFGKERLHKHYIVVSLSGMILYQHYSDVTWASRYHKFKGLELFVESLV